MSSTRSANRRGGVLSIVLAGAALVSVGAAAVVSFNPAAGTGGGAGKAPKASRQIQPGEVAVVLRLAGITPEGLAAAGATSTACETLFSTGGAYCLQAERLVQFRLAHRNVNLAKNHAVHPAAAAPMDGGGNPIKLAQAQTSLSDLEASAFSFVTSELNSGIIAKLTTIKANSHWGILTPYLTVNRTNQEWLALRGALSAKRFADTHGQQVNQAVSEVLSTADANGTVATAKQDYADHIAALRESWHNHEHSVP